MRILTVCGSLARGGTDRVAQNFTLGYQRAGHDVALLALFEGGPRKQTLESAGVEVFRGFDAHALERARSFFPDVVHVHRSGAKDADFLESVAAVKRANTRVIETNFFGRVDRSKLGEMVDVHFLLSEWCLWRWHNWLGSASDEQIGVVVPNAVDVDEFVPSQPDSVKAFRHRLELGDDALLIGRVGQPSGAKWHPSTIHAFASVAAEFPTAQLALVGLPKSYDAMIDALPADVRRRVRKIEFLNSDAELCDVYSSLDCFLHSASIGETFGLVLTEAMLCGCPVVTAARPHKDNSHPEVVGHGTGGLVAGSTHRLGDALRQMLRDREFRQEARPKLRDWVTKRYSLEVVTGAAIRVAQLALEHGDRRSLRAAIENDSGLQSRVPPQRIHDLLYNVIGAPAVRDVLNMKLRHTPMIEGLIAQYQQATLYRNLRRMRRRSQVNEGVRS